MLGEMTVTQCHGVRVHTYTAPDAAWRVNTHLIELPTQVIAVDGTRFEFFRLRHAETEDALMIGLPDHRVLITQDLIYRAVHVFLGEQAFDSWAAALKSYRALPYDRILPGHGAPGGPELYDAMARYLSVARVALSEASSPADLKRRLILAFPEFGGWTLLDHQMRFLFPARQNDDQHR